MSLYSKASSLLSKYFINRNPKIKVGVTILFFASALLGISSPSIIDVMTFIKNGGDSPSSFNIFLTSLSLLFAIPLLCIALYLFLVEFFGYSINKTNHDKEVIKIFDQYANYEVIENMISDRLLANHCLFTGQMSFFYELLTLFSARENKLKNKVLLKKQIDIINDLSKLHHFLGGNFYVDSKAPHLFKLYTLSGKYSSEYSEKVNELNGLCTSLKRNFEEFRDNIEKEIKDYSVYA